MGIVSGNLHLKPLPLLNKCNFITQQLEIEQFHLFTDKIEKIELNLFILLLKDSSWYRGVFLCRQFFLKAMALKRPVHIFTHWKKLPVTKKLQKKLFLIYRSCRSSLDLTPDFSTTFIYYSPLYRK